MKKEKVTLNTVSKKIDTLATIVVDSVTEKIDTLTTVVDNLAVATKRGFDVVDKRFDDVEERLERIEGTVTNHGNRIDRLSDDMRVVKTKVGIK